MEPDEPVPDLEKRRPHGVTLKNGARADLASVRVEWETLNALCQRHPGLVRAAHAIARGESDASASPEEFRRHLLTGPDGRLRPGVRDVLLSGFRETPDGPVVVNPVSVESEADLRAYEESERLAERNTLRILRHAGRGPDSDGHGRG